MQEREKEQAGLSCKGLCTGLTWFLHMTRSQVWCYEKKNQVKFLLSSASFGPGDFAG